MILLREGMGYLEDSRVNELALCVDEKSAREWMKRNRPNALWSEVFELWQEGDSEISMEKMQVVDFDNQKPFIVMITSTLTYQVEVMALTEKEAWSIIQDQNLPELVLDAEQINVEWHCQSVQAKEEIE